MLVSILAGFALASVSSALNCNTGQTLIPGVSNITQLTTAPDGNTFDLCTALEVCTDSLGAGIACNAPAVVLKTLLFSGISLNSSATEVTPSFAGLNTTQACALAVATVTKLNTSAAPSALIAECCYSPLCNTQSFVQSFEGLLVPTVNGTTGTTTNGTTGTAGNGTKVSSGMTVANGLTALVGVSVAALLF